MSPEITSAIFALIGAIIGALVASVGTFFTLRQQNKIWKVEKRLEELRNRQSEIDVLVEEFGQFVISLDGGNVSLHAPDTPEARAALYKAMVWSKGNIITTINSFNDFRKLLLELKDKRNQIAYEIDTLLNG